MEYDTTMKIYELQVSSTIWVTHKDNVEIQKQNKQKEYV